MGNKWWKVKMGLGIKHSSHSPPTLEESPEAETAAPGRFSDEFSPSPSIHESGSQSSFSSFVRLAFGGPKSHSKRTCAICLNPMKPGQNRAIFTAECSHAFHFHCIASNVKHGSQVCPVCRAKWKEIPYQSPDSADPSDGTPRIGLLHWPQDNAWIAATRPLPPPRIDAGRRISSPLPPEPVVFNDDEILDRQPEMGEDSLSADNTGDAESVGKIEVQTFPEVSAVLKSKSHANFTVLIHLKAPLASMSQSHGTNQGKLPTMVHNSRAPVDLVTVLDVSGSMVGTKLALLKQAMGFVIQNLGPSDRLSVVVFSSMARRLFPLCRMTDTGRQLAIQAVNSLTASGGTNIAQGLKKGAKVLTDRKWKNSVSSIILLSDGQDTYAVINPGTAHRHTNYRALLPFSIQCSGDSGAQIPVHTFGFGADHDAASMHSVAEASGGTFSFIETESVMQDAFAQCIGGLLSVVAQKLQVDIECIDPSLKLGSITAGSYKTSIVADARTGFVDGGDLYAEEERDFLVTVDVPASVLGDEMPLLKVNCIYRNPITNEAVTLEQANVVMIQRPDRLAQELAVSMKVDGQRNRLRAADAMTEARALAERSDLEGAVAVLESCRTELSKSASAQAGDRLCMGLEADLKEMQGRMTNRNVYEACGRAYVLSGLSSHTWQRATARGDSTGSGSLVQAYQTPSMVDMVTRSQTVVFGKPPRTRPLP